MDHVAIRKTAIQAIFSDEVLTENLLLKGGNALEIGLGIISRGSYDLDFSTPDAFKDVDEISRRIFAALKARFDAHGLCVIDERFEVKPPAVADDETPWWGGYRASFKLLSKRRHEELLSRPDKASIEALTIAGGQDRTFVIDISKHEFCGDRQAVDLDGCIIWLYTPAMLAIEKLRAICQQMPAYAQLKNKRPRARDFYDIHAIVSKLAVDLSQPSSRELCRAIFAAKQVPVALIARIGEPSGREYHRLGWPQVAASVVGSVPAEFDFYFNFTTREALKLQPLRIE
jgi:hypothetical protein